jgi:PKD repeat protein
LQSGVDVTGKLTNWLITQKPISEYAQDIIKYLMSFISIIAVIYIIYAGFSVMIGGGDEEKVKKAKNIILYVVVGIIIMWLAYGIVKLTLNIVTPWVTQSEWSIIPKTYAAYNESDTDTFNEYKDRLRRSIQDLESELRVNGGVSISNIQNTKSLLQQAYDRLPDTGSFGNDNDTAKRAVDTYLDIAMRNPRSVSAVWDAISKVSLFIDSAKIAWITGEIIATPTEGNSPLTVSFRANNIQDPSGTTPGTNNYIWWIRENGGYKRELGRGPSLVYQFNTEGTFAVFLDVVSGSRNRKGKIDTLPLSVSKQIQVKPKLWEVTLLINGINVTNLSSIKINPGLWKMGIILDATASRAIGKWAITDTIWDFGNGNTISYKWSPIVERQLFTNQWVYTVKLQLKSNDGSTFTKEIQLIVRDPSAVIKLDNDVGHVGEEMYMSISSLFGTSNNVEYSWQIQDDDNKKILKSFAGTNLKYKFDTVWKYIVTLSARNPNGTSDSDSRIINIESREPVASIETPKPANTEKPNVLLFDATKSYDPDTMSRKWLSYVWRLDGEKVNLESSSADGAKWIMTFDSVGNHTISVTVANVYGKVKTIEKTFEVTSILDVNMSVMPRVSPIWTTVTLIGRSENADFYEWNMGDGSPVINGDSKIIQHIYKKTGVYDATLTVRKNGSDETNQIRRKVYVTDTASPYALIEATNSSSSTTEDPTACGWAGAIVVNRSETTTLDGSKSINIDGNTNDLSYTWNYFGKVKNTASISEKFTDLWCFPVKLTVRSNKNGSTQTSIANILLRNQPPELTSISTSIDSSKQDSQKLLVKVTANGVRDPDGVVTSYIWYYTTESDKEPQNVQITQKPEITFVLPNITEKYYFGVILEDNDGAKVNSLDSSADQAPLILDNQNGNVYLPLISLSTPKTAILAGDPMHVSVDAKTILWTNITKKSEYSWDFDGDGKFDEKTSVASIDHVYKNPGTYSLKVRVTYNGVSNTKYQTIYVKNELKAKVAWYRLPDGRVYFMNMSNGIYDKALWNIWEKTIESPYAVMIEASDFSWSTDTIGKITVSNSDTDVSSIAIQSSDVHDISWSGIQIQSSPEIDNTDTIHIQSSGQRVLLSLVGNISGEYKIDTDTSIDSDLDGSPDNDFDNRDTTSSKDGWVFVIDGFESIKSWNRKIKISLFQNNILTSTKTITLVFDYQKSDTTISGEAVSNTDSWSISTFDKEKLDELSEAIRWLSPDNRVILMKQYNILVENWSDTFSKSKSLLDIQESINQTSETDQTKENIGTIIDALLIGDARAIDEVTVAATLIQWLVPDASPNKVNIKEKLDMILAHPGLLDQNKILGQDILKMVEWDTSIDTKYKLHIKNQLQVIIYGWQQSVPESSTSWEAETGSSGILDFVGGVVKIFFIILAVIIFVILWGYVFYRISRKSEDTGFQDFLIDSVFHSKKPETPEMKEGNIGTTQGVVQQINIDPLKENIDGIEKYKEELRLRENSNAIDPLVSNDPLSSLGQTNSPTGNSQIEEEVSDQHTVPDWLKAPVWEESAIQQSSELSIENELSQEKDSTELPILNTQDIAKEENAPITLDETQVVVGLPETPTLAPEPESILTPESESIPNWLKGSMETKIGEEENPLNINPAEVLEIEKEESMAVSETLPDWLINSVNEKKPEEVSEKLPEEKEEKSTTEDLPKKKPSKKKEDKTQESINATQTTVAPTTSDIPDWLK